MLNTFVVSHCENEGHSLSKWPSDKSAAWRFPSSTADQMLRGCGFRVFHSYLCEFEVFSFVLLLFSAMLVWKEKKINWNSFQGLWGGRNCPTSALVWSRQWLRMRVTCFQECQALRSALNSGENLKLSYLVLSCKLENQNFSLELLALYEVWKVNRVLRKRQRPETPAETGTWFPVQSPIIVPQRIAILWLHNNK